MNFAGEIDFGSLSDRAQERAVSALCGIEGLEFERPHRALLAAGRHAADVCFEALDTVNVVCEVTEGPPRLEALATNHALPGNLRFADAGGAMRLLSDTQFNGVSHLPRTFGQLRMGIVQALDGDGMVPAAESVLEKADVERALEAISWDDNSVVQLEEGWELRPRLGGQPTPVRMTMAGGGLRFHRTLLAKRTNEWRFDVIACEALRLNASIRHARLAWTGNSLDVESCLHAGQVEASWIELTAQAVSAAAARARTVLHILAVQPEVADCYAKVLLES